MLLLTEGAVRSVRAAWRHNKYFPYGPNSRLIRALLYTYTSKTTKSQCFPLLLWTEVQPVHTPVRTQAYGLAFSQSNFSILSVFCLAYNKKLYSAFLRENYSQCSYDSGKTWKRAILRKRIRENLEKSGSCLIFSATQETHRIYSNQPSHVFVCSGVQEAVMRISCHGGNNSQPGFEYLQAIFLWYHQCSKY